MIFAQALLEMPEVLEVHPVAGLQRRAAGAVVRIEREIFISEIGFALERAGVPADRRKGAAALVARLAPLTVENVGDDLVITTAGPRAARDADTAVAAWLATGAGKGTTAPRHEARALDGGAAGHAPDYMFA